MMMAKVLPRCDVADLLVDERELLHRGDDDLLAGLDGRAQVAGLVRVGDCRADLSELLDGVPICPSRITRSVTTMMESKTRLPSCSRPIS